MSDNEIERVTVGVKVKFSEKLNKMFPKADGIFDKNDHEKPLFDDADSLSNSDGMTSLQAQIIYKELNEGKLPKQLKFFSCGNSGINKLRIHATNKLKSELNKSNKVFLDYLTSDYAREILAKNKIKIHLDTGNINRGNANLEESVYYFLLVRQNKTKKVLHYEINYIGDFDPYKNEIIYILIVRLNFYSIILVIGCAI